LLNLIKLLENKKALLIDLDDTIIDYSLTHKKALELTANIWDFSLEQYELAKFKVKRLVGGVNNHNKFLYFKKMVEATSSKIDYYKAIHINSTYYKHFYLNLIADSTMIHLIKTAKALDKKICLVSNFNSKRQLEKLDEFGLLNYFDLVVTSEDIDIEKPNPLFFYYVLSQLDIKAHEALVIGNSIDDMPEGIEFYPYSSYNNFISICGKSGAGKTTLSLMLKEIFNSSILSGDHYHKYERSNNLWKIITHYNPNANHLDKLRNDITDLFYGKDIYLKEYNHISGIFSEPKLFKYNNNLIIEGLHSLWNDHITKYSKMKIFLDNKMADELKLKRDITYRGKSEKEVLESIKRREDDYNQYIYPQINNANIIITIDKKILSIKFTNEFNLKLISEEFGEPILNNSIELIFNINDMKDYRTAIIETFLKLKELFYVASKN